MTARDDRWPQGEYCVSDDGTLRITRTGIPPGLAISGEVDEFTYPGLVRALRQISGGIGEIHVSLARVLYCDLAGLRAIVDLTGARGLGSDHLARCVVLHEVPPQLRAALRIVGWDATPGLILHERRDSALSLAGGMADDALPAMASALPGTRRPIRNLLIM